MLNIERVDLFNESPYNHDHDVEIEFTTEDADPALTIVLKESEAMKLANMIMDKCSYKAKLERQKRY